MPRDESIASSIINPALTPLPTNNSNLTPYPSNTNPHHLPAGSTVIHSRQSTHEHIDIPATIPATPTKGSIDILYANTPDTPNDGDNTVSIQEAKVHLFNAYTVCLDNHGQILTLKQVQAKSTAYLSKHDKNKYKHPKLITAVVCSLFVSLSGVIAGSMNQWSDFFPWILILCGSALVVCFAFCLISQVTEKHEDYIEYYKRHGSGLRFDIEAKNVEIITFNVDYGFNEDLHGKDRFKSVHNAVITQDVKKFVCKFGDIIGIGQGIIKRKDRPDRYYIYINYKDGIYDIGEWKSKDGYGKNGKRRFKQLKSVMRNINENWLNEIAVYSDKVSKNHE